MIVVKVDSLLADRKMKPSDLARLLGCDDHTVWRIRTGRMRAFKLETMNTLCEFFNCQPSDVIEYMSEDEAKARYGESFVDQQKSYHKNRGLG